jgi:ABC-type methionine transport system ATPase subunit
MTFPERLITQPILFTVAKEFDIVPNIRRANVSATAGEVVLELTGEEDNLESAIDRFKELGVKVEAVSSDVVSE